MAQKFIICDNKIILGYVEYHKDLIEESRHTDVIGGGEWYDYKNVLYFYSNSLKFGAVNKEQFEGALKNFVPDDEFKDFKIVFSTKESLSDAIIESRNNKI